MDGTHTCAICYQLSPTLPLPRPRPEDCPEGTLTRTPSSLGSSRAVEQSEDSPQGEDTERCGLPPGLDLGPPPLTAPTNK